MSERATRRELLLRAAAAGLLTPSAAAVLAACGDEDAPAPGSTRRGTLRDADGDGLLGRGPGLALVDRRELGGGGRPRRTLAFLGQLTDVHVRDAQSPGRVPFLDRLGPVLGSTFRPHELLGPHVLAAALRTLAAEGPQHLLVTGDVVDSAQRNELDWALGLLTGRSVRPDSGARGYRGVQQASNPDPSYYRPDVDAPRHPGLLRRALRPVLAPRLSMPWWPALGNHDVLVQGEYAPTAALTAAATGRRLQVSVDLDDLPFGLAGRPTPAQVDQLLAAGLPGDALTVPADPRRAHLRAAEAVERLRAAAPRPPRLADPARLDYAFAAADDVHVVVLDLVRRDGGSGGVVSPAALAALRAGLREAEDRWVVVACHQPLHESDGAGPALALLDADPRVVAVVAGHRHRNVVEPRRTPAGGYWLVTTSSLVDTPQQWRALRVVETDRGSVALETWMVDHAGRPDDEGDLAGIARDLAFLDAQGGRPFGAAGPPEARNARLHLPRRAPRPPRRAGTRPARPPRPAPERGIGDGLTAG
ncbi:hypothetical protein [Conexibacter sp. SYSU D00693]|uniref:hypothetical protein n=1 Tax=Conexibacter sp. SYSU D00693 TaxID=2812560 RepID=UPI00196AE615|nr:hypothetical protein [Conexibacter sp. SYSU D00693]